MENLREITLIASAGLIVLSLLALAFILGWVKGNRSLVQRAGQQPKMTTHSQQASDYNDTTGLDEAGSSTTSSGRDFLEGESEETRKQYDELKLMYYFRHSAFIRGEHGHHDRMAASSAERQGELEEALGEDLTDLARWDGESLAEQELIESYLIR